LNITESEVKENQELLNAIKEKEIFKGINESM